MSKNEIDPEKAIKVGKLIIAIISAIIGFFAGNVTDSLFNF